MLGACSFITSICTSIGRKTPLQQSNDSMATYLMEDNTNGTSDLAAFSANWSSYDRRLQQYITEYEGINDENAEITLYFEELLIDALSPIPETTVKSYSHGI